MECKNIANFFKIFGDETRIKILFELKKSEMCVCEIVDIVGVSQTAVSHQIAKLKKHRLVKSRRDGKHVYYSLDDKHIEDILAIGLCHLSEER